LEGVAALMRRYELMLVLRPDVPDDRSQAVIDRTTRQGGVDGSLLNAIDRTRTAMGARLLRQWVRFPLCDVEHITARQNAIAALIASPIDLRSIANELDGICDIERIIARVAVGRAADR